jgi:hypothetical protein
MCVSSLSSMASAARTIQDLPTTGAVASCQGRFGSADRWVAWLGNRTQLELAGAVAYEAVDPASNGPVTQRLAESSLSGFELDTNGTGAGTSVHFTLLDRVLCRQHLKDIVGEERVRRCECRQRQCVQVGVVLLALTNQPSNRTVRLTKRRAFAHEVVSQVGGHHGAR